MVIPGRMVRPWTHAVARGSPVFYRKSAGAINTLYGRLNSFRRATLQ